jgi:phosphoribosylaminoimidazolecarboxamide formyltransferase/IMP cyclohydrolase
VDVVSKRRPSPEEVQAALFTWTVACFTRSNAVVIGTSDKTHGIGSGQRSRIDSAEDAIRLSRRGYGPEGCVLASDAFMPFPDVVELAGKHGITAIIYPLGSIKDQEVIDKADELGLAMIITRKPGEVDSERCFLHR